MDRNDFKGLFNLILLILFIAAAMLGPLVERWRKKKEEEAARRRAETGPAPDQPHPAAEAEPPPVPPWDQGRPRAPLEHVLEEVFGPYVERRRRALEEARQLASREAEDIEIVVDEDDEIRRMRETRRPAEPAAPPPPSEPLLEETTRPGLLRTVAATAVASRRGPTIDALLFRNPRLSPGAKLVLASEILGKPRALRRR